MNSRWLPNINWVRAALCPAVVLIATGMDRGYQTDFWHHIARGREIALTGKVVDVDPMTFAVAGDSIRDANWLTQLAYYRLHELGGLPLVQTVNSVILALAAALLVWICRRRGASVAIASAVSVFTFAGIWQTLLIRPQSLSLLLFVVLYAILMEAERRRWLLLFPPMLLALWANLHGGFPIGLLLIAAFAAATLAERWMTLLRRRWFLTKRPDHQESEPAATWAQQLSSDAGAPAAQTPFDLKEILGIRQGFRDPALSVRGGSGMLIALILCGVAAFAATLINPYGLGIYDYVFTLSKLAAGRQIEEWQPPSMSLWIGRVWAASVLGLIVLLAMSARRPRARDLFIALCFLPLACASVRMVPWWLLTIAPVLAMTLARNLSIEAQAKRSSPKPSLVAASALLLIGSAVLVCMPSMQRFNPVFTYLRSSARPEADLHAALEHLPERDEASRLFTRLEWGEYVDWAARKRSRAFIDGRIEIYPDDVWQQYHAVTSARADWQDILDARGIDYLLLDSTYHTELTPRVQESGRWKPLARSGPATLYGRADTGTAQLDGHEIP